MPLQIYFVPLFLKIIACAREEDVVLLVPTYNLCRDHITSRGNFEKEPCDLFSVQYGFFMAGQRIPQETLIADADFRFNLMSKQKITCNKKNWYDKLSVKLIGYYVKFLRNLCNELIKDSYNTEPAIQKLQSDILELCEREYSKLIDLDIHQIFDVCNKIACIMMNGSYSILMQNKHLLEPMYEYFIRTVSYKCSMNLVDKSNILSECYIVVFHYDQLDVASLKQEINENMSMKNLMIEMNLTTFFLDLLYASSDLEISRDGCKITEINTIPIFEKFYEFWTNFCQIDFSKFVPPETDGALPKLKVGIHFNCHHLKLFCKLYVCSENGLSTKIAELIDKITALLVSSEQMKRNKRVEYIYETHVKDIVHMSTLSTSFSLRLREYFPIYNNEIIKMISGADKQVHVRMKRLFGNDIIANKFAIPKGFTATHRQ